MRSSCSHGSSSSAASLSCISEEDTCSDYEVGTVSLGKFLATHCTYLPAFLRQLFWPQGCGWGVEGTGNWLWRAQYVQSYASAQLEYWFSSQTKQLKNFRALERGLQLKCF